MVYGVVSQRDLVNRADSGDNLSNARDESVEVPFRRATEALSRASVPFDVVLATDGGLAGRPVRRGRAGGVPDGGAARLLVADRAPGRRAGRVPGRRWPRAGQRRSRGQRDVGGPGPAARAPEPDPLRARRGADRRCPAGRRWWPAAGSRSTCTGCDDGVAAHLVNYGYDDEQDAAAVIARPGAGRPAARRGPPGRGRCDPAGPPEPVDLTAHRGRRTASRLADVGLYTVRGAAGEAGRAGRGRGLPGRRGRPAPTRRPASCWSRCAPAASAPRSWTPGPDGCRRTSRSGNGHEVSGVVVGARRPASTELRGRRPGGGLDPRIRVRGVRDRPRRLLPAAGRRSRSTVGLLEPIACAANAVELADVRLADDVVIIGAGFMGALVQQLVQLRGARARSPWSTAAPDVLRWPPPSAPPGRSTPARSRSPRGRRYRRRAPTSPSRSPGCRAGWTWSAT